MAHRIGDRNSRALQQAHQRETFEPEAVHHRFEIVDIGFERKIRNIPIGEAAAPLIIAHQLFFGPRAA